MHLQWRHFPYICMQTRQFHHLHFQLNGQKINHEEKYSQQQCNKQFLFSPAMLERKKNQSLIFFLIQALSFLYSHTSSLFIISLLPVAHRKLGSRFPWLHFTLTSMHRINKTAAVLHSCLCKQPKQTAIRKQTRYHCGSFNGIFPMHTESLLLQYS